ncbi:MarR family transcriptional regulator [Aminobacter sp. NyZ550]|uniref:MarR family winged helix-turn-helix transcriptional regulator n=1 Tax=Aminobacter TaxID=31988 RepID=UPI0012AEFE62|nr:MULTISPECIES: MarR family transcriptional regulator [unclassified Aminobacter]MRX34105.1 MarR family transcriptional regulator [Aminobacter sp. MDW-2]QNH33154.1 MarR family transcriptional regulator [Aminobacter sp. MDW-2]QOF72352.1 MarR family transcriptional regulator [Aminobacter sp. SR38]WAX94099.1 MarR family transcriptional regulator [Aminobacter sp. NyZ550]BBD37339.1 MarR family transcriptional regulator [Aminobacter sp. SS-2016]
MKNEGIDRLGFLIHDAARLVRRSFEQRGSEFGLSAAQWRLLVRLVKEEGVAQARLAELLEIEPISVSRLLDRMEEGGWIERRQGASDRRVRMIFPTDKALEAFSKVKAVAGEVYEKALAGLSDEQRLATVHGLRTIIDNLSAGEPTDANCLRETKT